MMEIRSYRRVFDLERRVYSVDRLRLNPGGVPVRGIVYFVSLLVASLLGGRVAFLGSAIHALPWYLGDLALPALGAMLLSVIRVEGRTFHLAARALVRHSLTPRGICGLSRPASTARRWRPDEILILPDGSDGRMRRLSYRGPGAVLLAREHDRAGSVSERGTIALARRHRRRRLTVRERPGGSSLGEGQVIALAEGARLRVLAGAERAR
jgi:hypothetical protein